MAVNPTLDSWLSSFTGIHISGKGIHVDPGVLASNVAALATGGITRAVLLAGKAIASTKSGSSPSVQSPVYTGPVSSVPRAPSMVTANLLGPTGGAGSIDPLLLLGAGAALFLMMQGRRGRR
jgi:hypothetical protein